MDVYGESGKRAHGSGFVGIDAETEDVVDNLEVYEALVNPQESSSGSGKGGSGMMPPMMMGGAGAGGAGASGSAGMSSAVAASTAGATARAVPVGGVGGVIPSTTAPAAAAGVGQTASSATTGAGLGGLGGGGVGGGGAGLGGAGGVGVPGQAGAGVLAAGADGEAGDGSDADAEATDGSQAPTDPLEQSDPTAPTVDGDGRVIQPPVTNTDTDTDVVTVDPAEIDRVAKGWSQLSDGMAGLSTNISNLQATKGDFGMVKAPEPSYGSMTERLQRMAGGASQEFGNISDGLSATTRNVRENEDEATATAGGIAQ